MSTRLGAVGMALYYRGRHCMQLVGQRQGVALQGREGINGSALKELRARQELQPRWLMLRYQVRDSEYGSLQREPLGYLGTEAIKDDYQGRLTLWYSASVGLTVSGL